MVIFDSYVKLPEGKPSPSEVYGRVYLYDWDVDNDG